LGRRRGRINKRGCFHLLDQEGYERFQNACDRLHRKYNEVIDLVLAEWTEKAEAKIKEREAIREQERQAASDDRFQAHLESSIRDIKYRIDSGIATDLDRKNLEEKQRQLDQLRHKSAEMEIS
jgi:hypothetical protein